MGTGVNVRASSNGIRRNQRGAVAIIVGLTLAVLIGFAGLALDLGRLYVNKSELQNAADSCALAASPFGSSAQMRSWTTG